MITLFLFLYQLTKSLLYSEKEDYKKLRLTFHDYLNFCGDKKDDGLLTMIARKKDPKL